MDGKHNQSPGSLPAGIKHSSLIRPRQVKIGDAASFVGTTPRAIRHYHEIGLIPGPERGSDDRRRYGYEDTVRLLWIHKMVDAGIALDDIRDAFADTAPAGADSDTATTTSSCSACAPRMAAGPPAMHGAGPGTRRPRVARFLNNRQIVRPLASMLLAR